MTAEEAKRRIGPVEMWRWILCMEEEWQERKPEHYYFAQLALRLFMVEWRVVHFLDGKKAPEMEVNDFLLKFVGGDEKVKIDPYERLVQKGKASKTAWLGWLGIDPNKPSPPKKPRRNNPPPLPAKVLAATRRYEESKSGS